MLGHTHYYHHHQPLLLQLLLDSAALLENIFCVPHGDDMLAYPLSEVLLLCFSCCFICLDSSISPAKNVEPCIFQT